MKTFCYKGSNFKISFDANSRSYIFIPITGRIASENKLKNIIDRALLWPNLTLEDALKLTKIKSILDIDCLTIE